MPHKEGKAVEDGNEPDMVSEKDMLMGRTSGWCQNTHSSLWEVYTSTIDDDPKYLPRCQGNLADVRYQHSILDGYFGGN